MTTDRPAGYRMRAVDTLRCARCDEPKPIASFRILAYGGRASYCGPCQNECTKAWRAANLERINLDRRQAYARARTAAGRAPRPIGGGHRGPRTSAIKVGGPVDRGLPHDAR
jgi:hypothetical protein